MKSGETKLFVSILIVALALAGFAFVPLLKGQNTHKNQIIEPKPTPEWGRKDLVPPGTHLRGNPKAPFTLVVFSDFQCPQCKRAAERMEELLKKNKDRLNIAFHHFQAARQHLYSITLAWATEAAGQQGKFWEMHDRLLKYTDGFQSMSPEEVMDLVTKEAGALKLDVLKFREAMGGEKVRKAVERDMELASVKLELNGTPSFYFIPPQGPPVFLPGGLDSAMQYLENPKNWK